MADPKYVNLYGIAHDQPDVYETSDLPEVDQSDDLYEEESKFVERLHVNAPEAFLKFQNKKLDSSAVDFSDNVKKPFGASGYIASSGQWELAGFGEKETPQQKLNRLKLELEHFTEELSAIPKNSEKEDPAKISASLSTITQETNGLLQRIKQFTLEDGLGMNITYDASDPNGLNLVKLQNKLEKMGVDATVPESDKNKQSDLISDQSIIKYQLKVKPNQTALAYTSRIAELEHRLNKLESLLGPTNSQLTRLSAFGGDENGIVDYSQWMVAKLSLLDTSQLDAIESRATTLNTRLEQLAEKSALLYGNQDPEKDKKVQELYELLNKARDLSEVVPNVLDRMIALESLHQRGKRHVDTLSHLELLQNEISSTINSNDTILKNMDDSLKSNISIIKTSIDSLVKRMDGLVSKTKS